MIGKKLNVLHFQRVKERKTYIDQDLDDDDIDGKRLYKVEDKLASDKYNQDYVIQHLKGEGLFICHGLLFV